MSPSQSKVIAGKYEIIKELGQGSFGTVFLVRHTDLGVHYALKLLRKSLLADEGFLDRFKLEAEILLRFTHPGSIQLRDFGRDADGLYYMAMDYCAGQVLEDIILKSGPLPIDETLEIMSQILAVLEAAHTMGVIHRDIKSNNVLIERDQYGAPVVRILDFGIARLREQSTFGSKVTLEGATIGTPDYMSPEQASGEADLDHRVDIYSSGILLYEMLSGCLPFRSSTIMQTLLKHLTQPVPAFGTELAVPNYILEIVLKALEKDRNKRYQTAGGFRADCMQAMHRYATEQQTAVRQSAQVQVSARSVADPAPENLGPQLLCLDDNQMILQIVKFIFEKEGYQVFCASNFSMIHDYIFLKHVPLMLCDVNLPGLPGSKICRMLKQATRKLKIILFSNIDERDLEKLSVTCRADAWLSKNSPPQTWIEKVREVSAKD